MSTNLEHKVIVAGADRPRLGRDVWVEPAHRRVRAFCGGVAVADSDRVLLAFEPKRLANYWFPMAGVRTDLLERASEGEQAGERIVRWTLRVADRVVDNAAWSYPDADGERAALRDHIAFHWSRLDAWYEEDDEVFVHPRDPYHRVDVVHSSRHVRVEVDGVVLAETTRPRLLFETGLPVRYYIPKLDVRMELFEPTDTTTRCPYKGVAHYWSVRAGDTVLKDFAWSYPAPIPECPKIENLVAFYNEKVDIHVDGELQPRPVTQWSR
jgi:uncharacterized protein (DUF427 family)